MEKVVQAVTQHVQLEMGINWKRLCRIMGIYWKGKQMGNKYSLGREGERMLSVHSSHHISTIEGVLHFLDDEVEVFWTQ